jgi:hypothetical protein
MGFWSSFGKTMGRVGIDLGTQAASIALQQNKTAQVVAQVAAQILQSAQSTTTVETVVTAALGTLGVAITQERVACLSGIVRELQNSKVSKPENFQG